MVEDGVFHMKKSYEDAIKLFESGIEIADTVYYPFQLKNPNVKYWITYIDFEGEIYEWGLPFETM